jgi:probable O-glycosylation ligase (exosortase A-associated)
VRAIVLLLGVAAALGFTFVHPFIGALLWEWFTLQSPHQEAFGFVQSAPVNFIIACVTIVALVFSRERKLPPPGSIVTLLVLFTLWMTFNQFFAFDTSYSWPLWSRSVKIFVFGLLIAAMASSRLRLYCVAWIAVISLYYYGVKGGLFTILTGGNYRVFGPPDTVIGDNNQLAVALLMVVPFANYLRGQLENKYLAALLAAASIITVLAVLGTYSRGALVGLGAMALLILLRTKRRFIYIGLVGIVSTFVLYFMPTSYFNRMNTLGAVQDDASFQGRLHAWRVAFGYASDHFPFGAGIYGAQLPGVYRAYYPNDTVLHAAHSIYFEILGDNGFIGLILYIFLLAAAFISCANIIRRTRKEPTLQWAKDMAVSLQTSLAVFCVAGAALSMAYYDLFAIELGMILALQEIVTRDTKRRGWSPFVSSNQPEVEGALKPYGATPQPAEP